MESQGERSVQDVALNNPIILTQVLKQSSIRLRNARLVCKFWNDIVLSLPDTRLAVRLRDVDQEDEEDDNDDDDDDGDEEEDDEDDDDQEKGDPADPFPFYVLCSSLDKRLAKRVTSMCGPTYANEIDSTRCIYSFGGKLMYFCEKFSDTVQILKITIHDEKCLKYISQALKNSCPNLKELRISCTDARKTQIEPGVLAAMPRLTVFSQSYAFLGYIQFPYEASWFLTSFAQAVVTAAPNLREVTLPWGYHPDLSNSKCLDSLTIGLNETDVREAVHFNVSELWHMLSQVGSQLVTLFFGETNLRHRVFRSKTWNKIEFRLPRSMPKLKTYGNLMLDVFECTDILKDFEKMPALKTLTLGRTTATRSTSLHETLQTISSSDKSFEGVKYLRIIEMHDPALLDGLKTAFPNLERLSVRTRHAEDVDVAGGVSGMQLGAVLQACEGGWEGLKHLEVGLPRNPERIGDVIKALLDCSNLYQGLKTLNIIPEGDELEDDLTEDEMDLFKKLLLAMDVMDDVCIWNINFGAKSMTNILAFMTSKKLSMSKFRMFWGQAEPAPIDDNFV